MERGTKITLAVIGSIIVTGIIGFVVYKEFIEEPTGEGDVSLNSKENNKITFTRKK